MPAVSETYLDLSLPGRFAFLIMGLRRAIGNYVAEHREIWRFTDAVVRALIRRRQRFDALFAHFRAGTLPVARRQRTRDVPAAKPDAVPEPVVLRLPRRRGWLTAMMGWQVAAYADEGLLKAFLADPEMVEFLAAAPQAKRILRPLWWMVSRYAPPEILRLPPRPSARRARPTRARAPRHALPRWRRPTTAFAERRRAGEAVPNARPASAFRA